MGRVKNQLMQEQEQEFEWELSYQEYLQEKQSEPSIIEIIEMARERLSPSTFQQMLWYVLATNNVDYKPTTRAQ